MALPTRRCGGAFADARSGAAPAAADGSISEVLPMKRIVSAALAAATVLAVSSVASSSPGSHPATDETALAPVRSAPDHGIESKVSALLAKMTVDEKLQQV